MPLKKSLAAAFAVVAGIAISVGVSASTAQAATPAVALPITQYSHMLVDPAHQHLFITSGSGSGSILVTDYSGQTVATIPGEPGATGLALSGDGSTVYAALANGEAVSAISTSTLSETARYATGTGTDPVYVAYSSGRIWFGYGAVAQGGIGSIDPSTSPATVTLNAAPGPWYQAPIVAATAGGELVAGGLGLSQVSLASYDVSGGTATVLAPEKGLSEASGLGSMQITPDGKDVVLASSFPYYQEVYQVSDLSAAGTYPTTYYPNAVSIAGDGTVAAGTTATNDIFMFAPGSTTPENTIHFYGQLAADGAALTPDGSLLFVVTQDYGSGPTLSIIPDPEQPVDPTSTVVTCSPGTVAIGQVRSCTATVTDTAAAGATTPTGTVTFTSNTSGGSFSSTSCTLSQASGGQASCTVSYTPAQAGSGSETITGTYGGDHAHAASSGQDTLDHTSAVVNCSGGTVALGQDASCTATVTDTAAAGATTPTGTVTFTSDTSGGSFSNTSCTLSQPSRGQASCKVSYTPSQAGPGSETITGTYEGDSRHIASSGQEALTVTLRVTFTSVNCQQTTPVLNKCTASVSDFSPGTPTPPTGTVSFTSSGPGVFSANQCTLSGSDSATYCTVYYARAAGVPMKGQTITASYSGDSTHQSSWWYTTLT